MAIPIVAFCFMESFLIVYPALDGARVLLGAAALGIPAFLSAFLTVPLANRLGGRMYFRRSFLLVFVGLMMIGAFQLIAVVALTLYSIFGGVPYPDRIHRVAILGYGAVLWAREVILSATSNSKHLHSLPAASLHPLLGLLALALFVPLPLDDIVLALAVFVLFFATAVGYAEIAKRPLLRAFGVDGLKLLRSTLDHYTEPEASGIAELESFFDSISVAARVRVGGLAFRVGSALKVLFVAPTVHPGPMGYVSGSDLPSKIARQLSDLTPNTLVAHGPSTHDENPATTAEVRKVAEAIRRAVGSAEFGMRVGRPCRATYGRASALAQAFGEVVLIVASFAPQPTDDIDSATGHAVVQEARLLGARDAIFVDAHNCLEAGVGLTLFGSQRSHEIIEASKAATQAALKAPTDTVRIGYGSRRGFATPDQGIGARGIEALIIETGGHKTAYVLFDGNNMVPGVRDAIRARIAGLVQESEAMTTDNHSVNLTMDGFNAVGAVLDEATIMTQAEAAVRIAIEALERADVAAFTTEVPDFRMFGPQSASRLTTTINATLAVLRPALYITLSGAIALGTLAIVLF
jgi:putative membrane protein